MPSKDTRTGSGLPALSISDPKSDIDRSTLALAQALGVDLQESQFSSVTGHWLVGHMTPQGADALRQWGQDQKDIANINKDATLQSAIEKTKQLGLEKDRAVAVSAEETKQKEKEVDCEKEKTNHKREETKQSEEITKRSLHSTIGRGVFHGVQVFGLAAVSYVFAHHGIDGKTFALAVAAIFSPDALKEIKEGLIGALDTKKKAALSDRR